MCFGGSSSSPTPAPAQVVKPTYVRNPYLDSFGNPAAGTKDNPNVTNRASLEIPIGFTGRGGTGEASGAVGADGTGLGIMKKPQSSGLAIRPAPEPGTIYVPPPQQPSPTPRTPPPRRNQP